jgi:hypothetical protein
VEPKLPWKCYYGNHHNGPQRTPNCDFTYKYNNLLLLHYPQGCSVAYQSLVIHSLHRSSKKDRNMGSSLTYFDCHVCIAQHFQEKNIMNTLSVDYYEREMITRMGRSHHLGPFTKQCDSNLSGKTEVITLQVFRGGMTKYTIGRPHRQLSTMPSTLQWPPEQDSKSNVEKVPYRYSITFCRSTQVNSYRF